MHVLRGLCLSTFNPSPTLFFFFFSDPAPTEISPFSLPAPFPISGGDAAGPGRRGWAGCEPLPVSPPYTNAGAGPLAAQGAALAIADAGVLVEGAKPADDGEGEIGRAHV